MAQVQIIQPYQPQWEELEKVAAYCRVSTDSKDQLNSYRTQIGYYTNFIAQHPGWELADIYADEGITGTSLEKRDEFKRMLADCRAGKIKRILVKSVSRFARNTLELIETTRELKSLGVVVVFEEQGIDTAQMLGEMQLTLLAMAAQEESSSISKNMRWSIQKRMENGSFITNYAPYGYKLENCSGRCQHEGDSQPYPVCAVRAGRGSNQFPKRKRGRRFSCLFFLTRHRDTTGEHTRSANSGSTKSDKSKGKNVLNYLGNQ